MTPHAKSNAVDAIAATPPVAYLGATVAGLSLPDWAALMAILYTSGLLLQMSWRFVHWCTVRLELRRNAKAQKRRAGDT